MENASRALLMAAGVLIGILILSLAVYLFLTFGASSAQMHSQIEENRLNEFNSQFTSLEGKDDVTIYDIVTIANLAKENNKYYEVNSETDSNYYISVSMNTNSLKLQEIDDIEQIIKTEEPVYDSENDEYKLPTYSCKVQISEITGRVKKVTFTKK